MMSDLRAEGTNELIPLTCCASVVTLEGPLAVGNVAGDNPIVTAPRPGIQRVWATQLACILA